MLISTFHLQDQWKKYTAVSRPLVSPAVAVCGRRELTPDLEVTPIGVTWFYVVLKYKKISQILHFQVILQVDLTWPLTFICDLWPQSERRWHHMSCLNTVTQVLLCRRWYSWQSKASSNHYTYSIMALAWRPKYAYFYFSSCAVGNYT